MKPFFLFLSILLLFSPIQRGHLAPRKTQSITTYYHYDGKPLRLDDYRFRRYILPQLRTMTREYSYLLQKLYPSLKKILPAKEGLKAYRRKLDKGRSLCSPQSVVNQRKTKCEEVYDQMYVVGRKLDTLALTLQKEMSFSLSQKSQQEIDTTIKMLRDLEEASRLNYHFLHLLEQGLTLYGRNQKKHWTIIKKAIQQTHEMEVFWDMIIIYHLTKNDQKLFDFIWNNFFLKIDRHVIHTNDKKYLIRHLEELNIAWNTFSMKLTKGSYKYPKAVEKMVLKMHDRWNAVLKIILYI